MIIAVFGGTGAEGRILIGQALDEGHRVTALVRPPARLGIVHDRLRLVPGDLSHAAAIDHSVEGADGVISLLGQSAPQPGTPTARATRNIVASMQKFGVRRRVTVARPGVLVPNDEPSVLTRLGIQATRRFRRPVYDDVVETARVVSESGLDWTIVRSPALRDGPRTGHVAVGYLGDGVTGGSLSRANMADFTLELAVSRQYIGKAPVVSDQRFSSVAQSSPVQIAPGVHCLRMGVGITSTNVSFVRSGTSWVLIDTAGPNRGPEIRSAAETIFGAGSRPAGIPLNQLTIQAMSKNTRELGLASIVYAFDPGDGVPGLPVRCDTGAHPGHASFFRASDRVLISGDEVAPALLSFSVEARQLTPSRRSEN